MSLFNADNLSTQQHQDDKKHHILIVDDEADNLTAISAILSPNYHVLTATNGKQALELITEPDTPKISLIISDQRMPQMTGVEFFEQAVAILPDAIRIIVTGFMDVDAIIDSINKAQIYRYIIKPFERQDLLLTVQRALEAYEMQQQIAQHQAALEQQVTERTQALQQTTNELEQALIKTTQQAQQLEQLNLDKDKFLSIISHDIRGPLGSLKLMTELLSDDLDENNKSGKAAKQINRLTAKIQMLLENILQWSRVHSGHIECDKQNINPHEIVNAAIDIYFALLQKFEITCLNEVDSETEIWADADMVYAIIRNFLSNALKFTPKQGTVRITLTSTESHQILSVNNSGSYIPPDAIDKLFRIETKYSQCGQRGEKGTGLGLLLCKEYMDKHGGEISVTSDESSGTTFSCAFPLASSEITWEI